MQCLLDHQRFRSRGRRLAAVSVSLLLSALLGLGSATASRAETSIVVDRLTPVSLGLSGDDLADLKNIYQGANVPAEPAMGQLRQIIADTGLRRMRLLQSDIYCDIDQDGKVFGGVRNGVFVPGDCYPLVWHLKWALDLGLSPHVAVAAHIPPSFVSAGPGESWDADTQARYRKYAEQLVRYVATKAFDGGAPSVIFEVSNELDIADSTPENWNNANPSVYALKPLGPWGRWLWWIDPSKYVLKQWGPLQTHLVSQADNVGLSYPYGLDARRLSRGQLPLQKIFSDAVATVRRQLGGDGKYAGKTMEIAGPAFAGLSFLSYPREGVPTLEEQFLEQTFNPHAKPSGDRFNAELDRFSFHYYGSTDGTAPFTVLRQMTDTIKAKLASLKASNPDMPEVKLFLSEWGPTAFEATDVNYSHKGAAWAAAFLPEAVAQKISLGSYLVVSDGQGNPKMPSLLGQASLMHKHRDSDGSIHYYPKPVANLFKMYAKMSGKRVQATLSPNASGSHLGAFATWDDGNSTANIMVYNYNPDLVFANDDNSRPDTPESFSLELDNLPFADGTGVTIQRYVIDATTSNLAAFLNDPHHPDPDLQMVELHGKIADGKLVLPSYTLGLGVSLWRVLPAQAAN